MENKTQTLNEMFEVEKIINSRIYRNKKYYLIKWLCYPINESTWEPKSNLKNLNYMLDRFEAEYPYSIDQNMYNIYCDESKKGIKKRDLKFMSIGRALSVERDKININKTSQL